MTVILTVSNKAAFSNFFLGSVYQKEHAKCCQIHLKFSFLSRWRDFHFPQLKNANTELTILFAIGNKAGCMKKEKEKSTEVFLIISAGRIVIKIQLKRTNFYHFYQGNICLLYKDFTSNQKVINFYGDFV